MRLLLDEHVGRTLEHVLRERGFRVDQAKDRFGERTQDVELLKWCADNSVLLCTNNAKDFEVLHASEDHAGILLYYDQDLPDDDPEGLARVVEAVVDQYGTDGLENELVDLGEWYRWFHERR